MLESQFWKHRILHTVLTVGILNEDIFVDGYSPDILRADKPSSIRNGGVCLYYKESLPIKERADIETLPETIVAEIKLNRNKIFLVLSYWHPNMPNNEFFEDTRSLEKIYEFIKKENPMVSIFCGDFNARSPLFWEGDTENKEGRILNNIKPP